MSHTIKSSEKLRKSAAEMETKALLFLMNFSQNKDKIEYFIVDFFNDLTGMDNFAIELHDIQSKGARNSSPKAVGKELVTLYKNYVSELTFSEYILFLGGVSNTFRIDQGINIFNSSNVTENAKIKMIEGLKEECIEKTYIDSSRIKDEDISTFIQQVTFVIDDKLPKEYVSKIIENYPNIIPKDNVLNAIFNEIRDKQATKKNVNAVENLIISTADEALNYYRHLTSSEIRLLTLQRIINRDPVSKSIPISFLPIYNQCPPEHQAELKDKCQQAVCRALFNKNQSESFWALFAEIYDLISRNPDVDVQKIYKQINKGKTIVIQAIMYTLGNVPTFPSSFHYKEYMFLVKFEINKILYKLYRKKKISC